MTVWYQRAAAFWEWWDAHQLDVHTISAIILWITWREIEWAMAFASASPKPGLEIAAIIAAVTAPMSILQAAVVKFHFEARAK